MLSRLRDVLNRPSGPLRATGTDDCYAADVEIAQRQAKQSRREVRQHGASWCDSLNIAPTNDPPLKSNTNADLGDARQTDETPDVNRAGGTRTPNQQIMSLLL